MPRLFASPRCHAPRPRMARLARPVVEGLEERRLLSTLDGGQWKNPDLVTYSIVPDGTSIGGVPSNLVQTMNADYGSTSTWLLAIEKAAAVWQQVAGINLTLVSDNGAQVGGPGDQQGDPRFGDIRIGGFSQSSSYMAVDLLPPPVNGGTEAGDMFFNTSIRWGGNGYDLETVAIHEFGHALGLGHSQIEQAVMYAYYNGADTSLSSDDVSGIQSIYGAPQASPVSNHTTSTVWNITPYINASGAWVDIPGVNIQNYNQNDYYAVTVPSNTNGTMVVNMQAYLLSSLAPHVTVFNSSWQGITQSIMTNDFGGTASVTINGVQPGQTYYIRCSAAQAGPGSDGAYGLEVMMGAQQLGPLPPPNTTVAQQPSQGGGAAAEQVNTQTTSQQHSSGLLGGLLGGLINTVVTLVEDVGQLIHIGTLSAYADYLTVKPGSSAAKHPSEPDPAKPADPLKPIVPVVVAHAKHPTGPAHHATPIQHATPTHRALPNQGDRPRHPA